ncbi:hypothetical protein TNIN_425111 [Trichonephila inaurata madagascariensis]|uniref:Uncharacterized protein n=1 Tax=Trichonephila inaurata madagascariensis TaxID=2747483 RepID=A0A8X6IKY0_9ARAC|nr:hypothetical protein TNIN_425111 [Trichonephila inaurata madagascariensis]
MIDELETVIQKVPGDSSLFADDVVIWAMASNIRCLKDSLNCSLLNLATRVNTNKMEVSVENTVSQLFTLSTKQHLEYQGIPLKHVSSGHINNMSISTISSTGELTSQKHHKRA